MFKEAFKKARQQNPEWKPREKEAVKSKIAHRHNAQPRRRTTNVQLRPRPVTYNYNRYKEKSLPDKPHLTGDIYAITPLGEEILFSRNQKIVRGNYGHLYWESPDGTRAHVIALGGGNYSLGHKD